MSGASFFSCASAGYTGERRRTRSIGTISRVLCHTIGTLCRSRPERRRKPCAHSAMTVQHTNIRILYVLTCSWLSDTMLVAGVRQTPHALPRRGSFPSLSHTPVCVTPTLACWVRWRRSANKRPQSRTTMTLHMLWSSNTAVIVPILTRACRQALSLLKKRPAYFAVVDV